MVQRVETTDPVLPLFYRGRSVFITGGTGFMGKVLLERLLSTCPEVDTLYIMMREKKGVCPQTRLQQLKDCQVFNVLREKKANLLDKIQVVVGDITQPGLGVAAEFLVNLKDVSIVFHIAASVNMGSCLKQAVRDNLRPIMMLLRFCDTLPKLEALIHVSTAYSNAELSTVEERVYPAPMDLHALLKLVENQDFDEETSKKYLGSKPNTYVFTKAIAEELIERHSTNKYSVAIFRPSIVVSSLQHPFPGWTDNLNGPGGVIAATGAGLLRVFLAEPTAKAAMIPVDIAVDTLLAVAWETAHDRMVAVRVYNCTNDENPTTWRTFQQVLNKTILDYPLSDFIIYPRLFIFGNKYLVKFLEIFLQTLPILLLAYLNRLTCAKSKRNLIKCTTRLKSMCSVLEYFSTREWHFKQDNVIKLRNRLTREDRAMFNLDPKTIDWEVLISNFVKGTRKHVLKERDSQLMETRKRIRRLGYFFKTASAVLVLLFLSATSNYLNRLFGSFSSTPTLAP